jgi:hypothetical protein
MEIDHISCDVSKQHETTVWQSVDFLNVSAVSTYIYNWFLPASIFYRILIVSDLHSGSIGLDRFLERIIRTFKIRIFWKLYPFFQKCVIRCLQVLCKLRFYIKKFKCGSK